METKISLFICACLLLVSCAEEINMATHEDLPYVVVCVLSDGKEQTLELYKPRYADQSAYSPVQKATITIEDTQKAFEFHFNGEKWISQFTPEYGHTYWLKIEIPGEPTITSHTRMPDNVRLYGFSIWQESDDPVDRELESVFFQFRTEEPIMIHEIHARDTSYRYNGACNAWLYPLRKQKRTFGAADSEDRTYTHNSFVASDHSYADRFNISGYNSAYMVENNTAYYYSKKFQWLKTTLPDLPVFNKFLHIRHPASYDNGTSTMPHKSCFRLATEEFYTEITEIQYLAHPETYTQNTDEWNF